MLTFPNSNSDHLGEEGVGQVITLVQKSERGFAKVQKMILQYLNDLLYSYLCEIKYIHFEDTKIEFSFSLRLFIYKKAKQVTNLLFSLFSKTKLN